MSTPPSSHWDVPLRSVWSFIDKVSGRPIVVRVTFKFKTTDGMYVSLRDPKTNAPLGNAPYSALGKRIIS